ncbi:hypothetical protein F503_00748 [Ophiostoma piceae UAMH 11346]|uniref:Uncharacterized protein n=1 Tax=Ophiostoma piceae (strain UAMH 11346) TaxID=1262450 RepID=S3D3N4_OPHP1|nr:hypothetical protein F503_00748 [Ophiostoma piceae UAMH 11346]
MDQPRSITHDDLHATYVQRSIRELQHMVQREEIILADLRRSAGAVPITSAAASLEIMTSAYQKAARSAPFLPFPDSVLPALLALRKTHQVTAESEVYLAKGPDSPLEKARRGLAADKARLADQQALQTALEARVADLRTAAESRRSMTAEQRRREQQQETLAALRAKQREYDHDTAVLLKALKEFIQEQLGPMLAAEELGGPVVGGMVDIQTDDLAAGFSSQGKLRKSSHKPDATPGTKGKQVDRRQRRIDEIWGKKPRDAGGGEELSGDEGEGDDEEDRDEATVAAAEMQELTEELLNALASAGGNSAAAYITIARESAAARFLVRSKVAQFHPRDATKLRLIDFGRELDD